MQYRLLSALLFSSLLGLAGCRRNIVIQRSARINSTIPLFIEMPQNVLVFENISSALYDALWKHFSQVGYKLQTSEQEAYRLKTKIKKIDRVARLVSPDILTYGYRVKIVVYAELYDQQDTLIAYKTFKLYQWVDKPKNPILANNFWREAYKELLERSVYRIDYYFRKFLHGQS